MRSLSRGLTPILGLLVVVLLLAAAAVVFLPHKGQRTMTAVFPRTVSLYEGSDVRILGVNVGKVDTVTPSGTDVVVKLHYDDKYKLPADAKAVIISPSIVGDRFVQLTPVYKGGAVMKDDARLDLTQTATPLELDEIFGSLNDLSKALGPNGANAADASGQGALTRLLDSTARNFGGQGVQFNKTVTNLGKLTKTLADNKDEFFGSAAKIEQFVNTLAKNDTTVRQFNDSLASGADLLADERTDLAAVLKNLSVALTDVKGFVQDNRQLLSSNISKLDRLSGTLVKRRGDLDQILKNAPAALNNLGLTYDPNNGGTLDTRANLLEPLLQQGTKNTICNAVSTLGLDLCSPGGLGAKRTGALAGNAKQTHVVEPIDRSLAGLVAVK